MHDFPLHVDGSCGLHPEPDLARGRGQPRQAGQTQGHRVSPMCVRCVFVCVYCEACTFREKSVIVIFDFDCHLSCLGCSVS